MRKSKSPDTLSSDSWVSEEGLQVVEDVGSDSEAAQSSRQGGIARKKPRRLKPSGIVSSIFVDPDASSEDELYGDEDLGGELGELELEEQRERRQMRSELREARQARKQNMREIARGHNRKDRRNTHKFLVKHGLTKAEAR